MSIRQERIAALQAEIKELEAQEFEETSSTLHTLYCWRCGKLDTTTAMKHNGYYYGVRNGKRIGIAVSPNWREDPKGALLSAKLYCANDLVTVTSQRDAYQQQIDKDNVELAAIEAELAKLGA